MTRDLRRRHLNKSRPPHSTASTLADSTAHTLFVCQGLLALNRVWLSQDES